MTYETIQDMDYNPAHAIWYILNQMVGLPSSWLDAASFNAAAATLYGENRGVSIRFNDQLDALGYVESLLAHVGGVLRYGAGGKLYLKLVRDDWTAGDLPLVDESMMIEPPALARRSWIDTINQVQVKYSQRQYFSSVYTIASIYDDNGCGYGFTPTTFSQDHYTFGGGSGVLLRFQLDIPRNASIGRAFLRFVSFNNSPPNTVNAFIRVMDSSNPDYVWATDYVGNQYMDCDLLSTTLGYFGDTAWSISNRWYLNQTYDSADFASLLQPVVHRSDWTQTSKVMIRIWGVSPGNQRIFWGYAGAPAKAAQLHVSWSR